MSIGSIRRSVPAALSTPQKLLASSIFAAALSVQAGEAPVLRMAPVLVTATLSEMDQREAPAATTVVTREQIKQTSARNLAEVLRETTGISMFGRGVGNRRVMNIRGMESHHTLILVDGRRVSASDAVVGHSDFQNSWVPVESIERIEVVRGSLSSLYGSEGMGGVVNIITRKAGKDWHGNLSVRGGQLDDSGRGGDESDISFSVGGGLGERLNLRLDGEFSDHEKTADKDNETVSEVEGKEISSVGVNLSYQLAEGHDLELQRWMIDEERPRDTLSRGGVLHKSTYDLERRMTSLRYSGEFKRASISAQLYQSSIDSKNSATNGVRPSSPQKLTDTVLEMHASQSFFNRQLVTAGFEFRKEELDHPMMTGGSDSLDNKALFLQDEIELGTRTLLTLGARVDNHEIFGNELSPRVYLVYNLSDQFTIKGGYGEGFRAPTLKQISPNYRFEGFHTFVGNSDLGPETNATMELAVQYHGNNLSGGLTVFRNDVDDLVQTNCILNCSSRFGREFEYINVNKARIDGIEFEMNADLGAGFAVALNLTQLDAENRTNGKELEHRPELSSNIKLAWTSRDQSWYTALRNQYVGPQVDDDDQLPSYNLWHFSLRKRFNDTFSLRAGMDNIADERLVEKDPDFSFEERGRFAYIGLDLNF